MFRFAKVGMLVIVAVALLFLSGCADAWVRSWRGSAVQMEVPEPEDEDELLIEGEYGGLWIETLGTMPHTLDPAQMVTLDEGRVAALLYNGLVRYDVDGTPLADLAENWEVHRDGLQYTFELRRDVTFSNGHRFTADDVIFSFLRLLCPQTESPRAWVLGDILGAEQYHTGQSNEVAGIVAEDEYTVTITLEQPRATFLSLLATTAAFILNRETVTTYETTSADAVAGGIPGFHPVGTGPFSISEYGEGEYLKLARRSDYHGSGPFLDGIRFEIGIDQMTAREMFSDGRLSITSIRPEEADQIETQVLQSPELAVFYLGLNNNRGPTEDVRVRQAINYALDTSSLLEEIMPGAFAPAAGSIPPGIAGYGGQRTGFGHNPAKAQELLDEAGYTGSIDLEMIRGSASSVQQITDAIAEQLSEVNLEIEMVTAEPGQTFNLLSGSTDYDLFYLSWWADFPDAENFLRPLFHSEKWGDAGNRTLFSCPETDVLLDKARSVYDRDRRLEIYAEIEELVFSQAPWVPLYFPVSHQALQPFVRGYELGGVYASQKMTTVWFDRAD